MPRRRGASCGLGATALSRAPSLWWQMPVKTWRRYDGVSPGASCGEERDMEGSSGCITMGRV